jgi:dynein heavy chain, axonemal
LLAIASHAITSAVLSQVSNDVINRCRSAIILSDAFSANVMMVMGALKECIAAGAGWKILYDETADVVRAQSARIWDFDTSPIFAHVDAFVQRCMDLLDICEAQVQFGRQRRSPVFGGTRGDSITQSIEDIQASFQKVVNELAGCGYDILDVKVTRWHDDFNQFKASVKDLEELLIKATDHAIDTVTDLTDHMHLIESLQVCSVRLLRISAAGNKTSKDVQLHKADAVFSLLSERANVGNGVQRQGPKARGEAHQ